MPVTTEIKITESQEHLLHVLADASPVERKQGIAASTAARRAGMENPARAAAGIARVMNKLIEVGYAERVDGTDTGARWAITTAGKKADTAIRKADAAAQA